MYLGLDIGTSGVKALLIDQNQTLVGSTASSLKVSRPYLGWSEQQPDDWIKACEHAIEQLKTVHPMPFSKLKGISFSGQMHGATLLDRNNKVLRPCILWNDTRSHLEAAELDTNPLFRKLSGNIVFPGFTAPKLMWVARHEPETFSKVAKVLLPKDYIAWWLSGEHVTDMSDASGTSWLDVNKRQWSQRLLDASGMRLDQMPRLVEGSEAIGTLRKDLAKRWGLANPPIIAAGAGDNAASAIGMGIIKEGQAFLSLGTSGVLFAATDGYKPNAESAVHTFCHALPNTWHQMGVILSASDALNWHSKVTGRSAEALDAELPSEPSGPSTVQFLPYLAGERTPHNDANVRGAFIGLSHETTRVELTQSVMEGVAFAIRDNLEALRQAGSELTDIIAVGGGSKSLFWLKTLANTLNKRILVPASGDFGAAFGAARLAFMAAENVGAEQLLSSPEMAKRIEPNTDLIHTYTQAFNRYQLIYPAVKAAQLTTNK